jgi:hypothetical protein
LFFSSSSNIALSLGSLAYFIFNGGASTDNRSREPEALLSLHRDTIWRWNSIDREAWSRWTKEVESRLMKPEIHQQHAQSKPSVSGQLNGVGSAGYIRTVSNTFSSGRQAEGTRPSTSDGDVIYILWRCTRHEFDGNEKVK